MRKADFQTGSPGRLVGTEINARRERNGVPEIVAVQGLAFVPNPLPPALDWERTIGRHCERFLRAERNIARLDAAASRLPNPHLLLRPLMYREAVESSEIENTIATLEEVVLQSSGARFERPDPAEVHNYIRALDFGLKSDYPFGKHLANEMHAILMSGVRGAEKRPGNFRNDQNLIGKDGDSLDSARFVPPPPGPYLNDCMAALFEFLSREHEGLPALVRIALMHYQFEAVHPYRDGNGRLGRLLITLALCRFGLLRQPAVYMSGYFERNRKGYYDRLLAVSTRGAWDDWLAFFLDGAAEQAADASERVDALFALREEFAARITSKRMSVLMRRLIDHLFESPAITVRDVIKLLKISDTAARRHVQTLVGLGVLEEWRKSEHPQRYIARDILRVAEGKAIDAGSKKRVRSRKKTKE